MRKYSLVVSITFILLTALNSCQVGRFFIYNFADINDHKKFQSRPLNASENPFQFTVADSGYFPKAINKIPFDDFLEENNSVAFLIIKNDTIQYEKYFQGYDKSRIVPSFSMAKSVTSILIGIAIDDGFIKSVDEAVTNYIPELKGNGFDDVTIKHLLQMTAGVDFKESYSNPFGDAAAFYYGRKLRKQISKMELKAKPGESFQYESGSPQLLGLILERAIKDKSVTAYLQEKVWGPLQMEFDASWSIDKKKNGLEKTFCCINARARDYAKLGRLYLNNGNWNGKQIVSEEWVKMSTKLDTSDGSASYYQYQWWLENPGKDFMAEGILGQFIYVHPEKNLIMVRLGKKYGNTNWGSVFSSLSKIY